MRFYVAACLLPTHSLWRPTWVWLCYMLPTYLPTYLPQAMAYATADSTRNHSPACLPEKPRIHTTSSF